MKYKVGDKVRVRTDLMEKMYGAYGATRQMLNFAGKMVTIGKCFHEPEAMYNILEDNSFWNWTDLMFASMTKSDLTTGMRVIFRNGRKGIVFTEARLACDERTMFILLEIGFGIDLMEYDEKFKHFKNNNLDIVEVRICDFACDIINFKIQPQYVLWKE